MFYKIFYNRSFYFLIGVLASFLSSLSVLDLNSAFWLNDESRYLYGIKNIEFSFTTTIRYNFFSYIVKFYFLIFSEPFYVVVFHKILVVFIYTYLLGGIIVKKFNFKTFTIIFISLSYLNLFFLRESMIALVGLSLMLANNKFCCYKIILSGQMDKHVFCCYK